MHAGAVTNYALVFLYIFLSSKPLLIFPECQSLRHDALLQRLMVVRTAVANVDARDNADAASQLATMSKELQGIVGRFKL
jgi:hypothetical protein